MILGMSFCKFFLLICRQWFTDLFQCEMPTLSSTLATGLTNPIIKATLTFRWPRSPALLRRALTSSQPASQGPTLLTMLGGSFYLPISCSIRPSLLMRRRRNTKRWCSVAGRTSSLVASSLSSSSSVFAYGNAAAGNASRRVALRPQAGLAVVSSLRSQRRENHTYLWRPRITIAQWT